MSFVDKFLQRPVTSSLIYSAAVFLLVTLFSIYQFVNVTEGGPNPSEILISSIAAGSTIIFLLFPASILRLYLYKNINNKMQLKSWVLKVIIAIDFIWTLFFFNMFLDSVSTAGGILTVFIAGIILFSSIVLFGIISIAFTIINLKNQKDTRRPNINRLTM